jgi:hypothetical protein
MKNYNEEYDTELIKPLWDTLNEFPSTHSGIMGMIGVARQAGGSDGLLSDCKLLWISEGYYDSDDLANFIMNDFFCRGMGEEWKDYI